MRNALIWFVGLSVAVVTVLTYLIATGERGLSGRSQPARTLNVARLDASQTEALGWSPQRLDTVFTFAAGLSSDAMMIVTKGKTVAAFGELGKPYATHSIRKSLLSAVVGQHTGPQPNKIRLDATLQELGIDDMPQPLSALQKQTSVRHLLMSTSGINHAAAAEGGLTTEKDKRLGTSENKPGTIWAYNNWDYNALTTVLESVTGQSVATAFRDGISSPLGMQDFTLDAVSYIQEPQRSKHRAAAFRMSARDLARFGQLYLNKGLANGQPVLSASWIDRIAHEHSKTGRADLRWGHGYLWWLPGPNSGLPAGTFWAWGLGNQALFVIPAWNTVIVHQADTTEFLKRFVPKISTGQKSGEAALEELILSCRKRSNRNSEYCIEHRFITRREFTQLVSLIAAARHSP